jgi:hypothetical protein
MNHCATPLSYTRETSVAGPSRKEQLERRLEQSRRLLKTIYDPTPKSEY